MALTGRILASIYRINQVDLKNSSGTPASQGVIFSLPSVDCVIRTITAPAVVANGVTMLSVIELLPTGLNQPKVSYFAADTAATLATNGS